MPQQLARFSVKVHLIIYCIEDGSEKAVMEILLLSCGAEKTSLDSNPLLRGSLDAAGSRISSRLIPLVPVVLGEAGIHYHSEMPYRNVVGLKTFFVASG